MAYLSAPFRDRREPVLHGARATVKNQTAKHRATLADHVQAGVSDGASGQVEGDDAGQVLGQPVQTHLGDTRHVAVDDVGIAAPSLYAFDQLRIGPMRYAIGQLDGHRMRSSLPLVHDCIRPRYFGAEYLTRKERREIAGGKNVYRDIASDGTCATAGCLFVFLLLDLLHVELQLLAFEDVPVAATALAGPGCNARVETAADELLLDLRVDNVLLQALLVLLVDGSADRRDLVGSLLVLLQAQVDAVVLRVPLAERGRIDDDDGALHQRLGSHQLVGRGVVHNVNDTRAARGHFGPPGEVARLQAEGTELQVATTAANDMDSLLADLGVGGRAPELVLLLLLVDLASATGGAALVARITRDTHANV